MAKQDAVNDAVLAYRGILDATKTVFGEKGMTNEVMCAAIRQAGMVAVETAGVDGLLPIMLEED